jgi:peroxiredoxin
MIRLIKDWALAFAVGAVVYLIVGYFMRHPDTKSGPAPDFELVNVAGGTVHLEELRGKPVVLNFWGSWCPPCRAEIPEFSAFAADHPEVPVLGVAVNSGSGANLAKAAKTLGVTYTVLESTSAVLSAYGVDVFPTTYVLDPKGTVTSVYVGGITRDTLDKAVAAASK